MNPNNPQPTPEEIKAKMEFEKTLNEVHSVNFTKGQLILIFNILTRADFKYADFLVIKPIVEKINPIVAVESHTVPNTNHVVKPEPVILGTKEKRPN